MDSVDIQETLPIKQIVLYADTWYPVFAKIYRSRIS